MKALDGTKLFRLVEVTDDYTIRIRSVSGIIRFSVAQLGDTDFHNYGFKTKSVEDRCAPGKPEATRVKVPPVELDGSRPKEMPGMRPRGRSRKRGIF